MTPHLKRPLWKPLRKVSLVNHQMCPWCVRIQEHTKSEECGFQSENNRGLKIHIRKQHSISQIDGANDEVKGISSKETQTDEICHYCKDFIECLDKHNISGFCPKNKASQPQVLYQQYGHQNIGLGSGFPPSQFEWWTPPEFSARSLVSTRSGGH